MNSWQKLQSQVESNRKFSLFHSTILQGSLIFPPSPSEGKGEREIYTVNEVMCLRSIVALEIRLYTSSLPFVTPPTKLPLVIVEL